MWAQDENGQDLSGLVVALQQLPAASASPTNPAALTFRCDAEAAMAGNCLPGSYNLT